MAFLFASDTNAVLPFDSDAQTNLLIVTPVLPPAPGGGGIYTQLLASGLLEKDFAASVSILTERHPSCLDSEISVGGRLRVFRWFPFRAGVAQKTAGRYFWYLLQNLQFLLIPWLLSRLRFSHVLIHSSFHNNPNLMWLAVWLIRLFLPDVKLICDVRDPKLPRRRFTELDRYHAILCCSENVYLHLSLHPMTRERLVTIPIIVTIHKPEKQAIKECMARHGVDNLKYLFNGSGILKEKGIDLALEVARQLHRTGEVDCLVVAGRKRDWSPIHEAAEKSGLLRYVGILQHNQVIALSAGAEADINLSHVDSMPRASLEALCAGARVLLPQGVPEFDRECPEFVATSQEPDVLAAQISRIIRNNLRPNFDLARHSANHVLSEYQKLFNSL